MISPADTAGMPISTALVLLTTPALACFYGGLVGAKNVTGRTGYRAGWRMKNGEWRMKNKNGREKPHG